MKHWMKLAGIERLRGLFIEGEGGGGDAGGGAASGGSGGGDGGAGAGSPTPATPAVGTTVNQGGGAPASTQSLSSTLVDEKGKPVRELGEDGGAFLQRHRDWKTKQPTEDPAAKTPEQIAAETQAAEAAKASAAKPAEGTKTPEQLATEKAAADAKAAEDAKAAAAPVDDFYEDLAPIPTEDLARVIKEHPAETEAFLKATGLTQDQLFANSRLAAKAGEFSKEFATIEGARHAKVQAEAFGAIEDVFTEIKPKDLPSTRKFINEMLLPLTYLRNDDGSVMVDKDTGLAVTDGTVFSFLDNVYDVRSEFMVNQLDKAADERSIGQTIGSLTPIFDAIAKVAKKIGGDRGEQLELAAGLLKGCGKAGSPSGDGELSEEVKARLADADRVQAEAKERQKGLDDRAAAEANSKIETFKEDVGKESSTAIRKLINGVIDRTSIGTDKFLRDTVIGKIEKALIANMMADPMYRSQRDGITVSGPNAKTKAAWVALNEREAKARLRTVAEPIFAEAGAKKLAKGQERQSTINAQADASNKSEPKGGTSTSLPKAQTTDPHEILEQARTNLRNKGVEIDTASLLAERRRLLAQVPA